MKRKLRRRRHENGRMAYLLFLFGGSSGGIRILGTVYGFWCLSCFVRCSGVRKDEKRDI